MRSHIAISMFQLCERLIAATSLEKFLDKYGMLPLVQPDEEDGQIAKPGNFTKFIYVSIYKFKKVT